MSTTEEKIIEASLREFSEYGFAGARVDRIAKIAKVNKAMIYYHFKSKEKLYESVLSIYTTGIRNFVENIIPDGEADVNQIYSIITTFINYMDNLSPEFVRIILGELAGGGKYLKKYIFPQLIGPVSSLLIGNLSKEISQKKIRPVNPNYTFQQIVGSIMFFTIMKVAFKGTELHDILYSGNYAEKFRDNLIDVISYGLELRESAHE